MSQVRPVPGVLLARILWIGAAVLAGMLGAAPAYAGSLTTASGHTVRWDGGLDEVAETVARQIPVVRRQVAATLGFDTLAAPAEFVLVRGLQRMRQEVGAAVPDWAGGVCVASRSRIVLRVDLVVSASPLRSATTTLRHEMVHLAWFRRAGSNTRRLPLWVEEGMAEEIGGGISVDGGARLDFAAAFGRLIPLEELDTHWPVDAGRAALAYRQGRSWVRYFVERNGWDRLQQVLRDLAAGEGLGRGPAAGAPFDELIFEHTGSTLSHWKIRWRRHLEETSDPWFHLLLRDFTGTIFLAIAVIGGVGYLLLRRRRRRQIEALPDEPYPLEEAVTVDD